MKPKDAKEVLQPKRSVMERFSRRKQNEKSYGMPFEDWKEKNRILARSNQTRMGRFMNSLYVEAGAKPLTKPLSAEDQATLDRIKQAKANRSKGL